MLKKLRIDSTKLPLIASVVLFVLLFLGGSVSFSNFFSLRVITNLLINNAHLIVIATGLCFVLLTGGIDLSVGSMVALVSMVSSSLIRSGTDPFVAMTICLVIGVIFGFAQGFLVVYFKLHPWIVTLAGMFLARGICYLIDVETIPITNDTMSAISSWKLYLMPKTFISLNVIIALVVVVVFFFVARFSGFGRNIYAIGGNEQSALLMGLPVKRTKIMAYVICGFCASLGGLMFTIYTLSGYGLHANGLEMDAIAACVIGGVLLTGGVGSLWGPLFGVLTTGIIRTLVDYQGTLSSWWTRIFVGGLMLLCILLQRAIVASGNKKTTTVVKKAGIKQKLVHQNE